MHSPASPTSRRALKIQHFVLDTASRPANLLASCLFFSRLRSGLRGRSGARPRNIERRSEPMSRPTHDSLSRRERQIMDVDLPAGPGDGRRGPGGTARPAQLLRHPGAAPGAGGEGTPAARAGRPALRLPADGRRARRPGARRSASSCRRSSRARRPRPSPRCSASPAPSSATRSSTGFPA